MSSPSPTGSDRARSTEGRLPPNAQRIATASVSPRPLSISGSTPRSLSHATELLLSSSPPMPAHGLLQNAATATAATSSNSVLQSDIDNEDQPLLGGPRARSSMVLPEAEAARRLKRHLVTRRPQSEFLDGSQPRSYGSISVNESDADSSSRNYYEDNGNEADDDDNVDNDDNRHVPVDPFTLPSGDITHHLYRWQEEHSQVPSSRQSVRNMHNRRRSFSAVASDTEWDVAYTPEQIRAPGGFRRQFVQERATREGRPANILTTNFVDFIGLYGHFAGEDYPSDEDDDVADEEEIERGDIGQRTARATARDIRATATPRKAFFLLVKSFVGTGVLVLPRAFFNGGLIFSTILMSAIAWYALHCMVLLSDVYLKIGGSYGDLALKLYGRPLKYSVMISIVLAQLGFCCAYVIFVATNMQDLWNSLTNCKYQLSTETWILIQLLVYIPLAFVRKIKKFASISVVGTFFILIGLGYLFMYDFWLIIKRGPAEVVQFNPSKFPLLAGTAAFSYEGISLVIPIVESMEKKEKFNSVLTSSLVVCAALFVCIGAFSYMALGDSVEAVVLLNLPSGTVWTMGVQLLYSLAIIMSVPLQLFPAIRIIESGIFTRSGKGNPVVKWQKNLFRALLVVFIAIVAIFGAAELDNFIAIVGASSCLPLSFLYPVMLHYRALANTWWARVKDLILVIIALFGLVYVTYISIETWGTSSPPLDRCATP
ncbi:transmembrane amino acid transporter protein-domain-containing protein [Coemansia spiralis]|nr:transmembrane amino acid transporter protein-domain-containing protein [Coemansia spiralis]